MIKILATHFSLMISCVLGASVVTPLLHAQDRFQPQADGILDTQTGLVWGFDISVILGQAKTQTNSENYLSSYLTIDENGNEQLANDYADTLFREYGIPQSYDWRLPTLAEARDCIASGLIFLIDRDPSPDFQVFPSTNEEAYYWTSSGRGNQEYGFNALGQTRLFLTGSTLRAIAVRSTLPAPPGNGGGKGKK